MNFKEKSKLDCLISIVLSIVILVLSYLTPVLSIWEDPIIAEAVNGDILVTDEHTATKPSDDTAPEVNISSPQNSSSPGKVGDAISLTANASDDVGVTKVEFYVDGNKVGESLSEPYVCTWQATGGNHQLFAKAYDASGKEGISSTVDINIGTDIAAGIIAPTNGSTVEYGSTVCISAYATSKVPVEKVQFFVDDLKMGESFSEPYQFNWTAIGGKHQVVVVAYDVAGNSAKSTAYVIVPAEVKITNPVDGSFVQGTVEGINATFSTGPQLGGYISGRFAVPERINMVPNTVYLEGTTYSVLTDVYGNFRIDGIDAGDYNLIAFGSGVLPLKKYICVSSENPYVTLTTVDLIAGDADGNGIIDNADSDLLSKSYDYSVGDVRFNPDCDFNKDGTCNLFDLMILSRNWNKTTNDYVTTNHVSNIDPVNNETNVPISKVIKVTFSENVLASVYYSDITLKNSAGNPVTVSSSIYNNILTITPSSNLTYSTEYTLTIPASAVKDGAGNDLETGYTMQFTTMAAPDTTPPTVSSTDPANGATGVPLNKVIKINFSEGVVAGENIGGISLKAGSTVVGYTYSLSGSVLTITPQSLSNSTTTYTVTVPAGGVKDAAGNGLATECTFSFTTVADTTPPTVSSTDPLNGATDVPFNKAIIKINFSEVVVAGANIGAISLKAGSTVVGYTYSLSGSVLTITPQGLSNSTTTYTVIVPAGAVKDPAGNGLATACTFSFTTVADTTPPTVSSTDPVDNATGVPSNKVITANFSEDVLASVYYSGIVLRTTTGKLVAASKSIHKNTVSITPNSRLAAGLYVLDVPAGAVKDSAGNNLETRYSMLFKAVSSPDTTPPVVSNTDPVNNGTGVPVDKVIKVTFSENVLASVYYSDITLKNSAGNSVTVSTSIDKNILSITPSSNLAYSEVYTLTIPASAVKDSVGNNLVTGYTLKFTMASPDTTPPVVSSTDPVNNGIGVPVDKVIKVNFSENVLASVYYSGIALKNSAGNPVTVSTSIDNNILSITPSSNLAYSEVYTLTIPTSAVKDSVGNNLETGLTLKFTTMGVPDIQAPVVSSTDPENNAAGVPVDKVIKVTFSENVLASVYYSDITLENSAGNLVTVSTSIYNNTLSITPSSNLVYSGVYTLTIPASAVKDSAGNNLETGLTLKFTMMDEPDTKPPVVSSTDPENNATGVPVDKVIKVTFSENVLASVYYSGITLKNSAGNPVAVSTNIYNNILSITPSSNLSYAEVYTFTIPASAVNDSAGNNLATGYDLNFTTMGAPDTTAPVVNSTDPVNNSTGVSVNKAIKVDFSENVLASVNYNGIALKNSAGNQVTVSTSVDNNILSITPSSNLSYSEVYTLTVPASAVKDNVGNNLATGYTLNFTTMGAPDTTAPIVSSTDPGNGATDVPIDKAIKINFSENVVIGANIGGISLKEGTTVVGYTYSLSGNVLTIIPQSLSNSATYTMTVPAGAVEDSAGNRLVSACSFSFKTVADTTPPTVISTDPANGATGVPVNKVIKVNFSEDVLASRDYGRIVLKHTGTGKVVRVSTSIYKNTLSITPSSILDGGVYILDIPSAAVEDCAGNLSKRYILNFRALIPSEIGPPVVISTDPMNNGKDVIVNKVIKVNFSENVVASVYYSGIALKNSAGNSVTVSTSIDKNILSITTSGKLAYSEVYTLTIPASAVKDTQGDNLTEEYRFQFTTNEVKCVYIYDDSNRLTSIVEPTRTIIYEYDNNGNLKSVIVQS